MILKIILHFVTTFMLLCQDDFELNITYCATVLLCQDNFELNITFPNYRQATVPR